MLLHTRYLYARTKFVVRCGCVVKCQQYIFILINNAKLASYHRTYRQLKIVIAQLSCQGESVNRGSELAVSTGAVDVHTSAFLRHIWTGHDLDFDLKI